MEKTNPTTICHLQQLTKARKCKSSAEAHSTQSDEAILLSGAEENSSCSSSLRSGWLFIFLFLGCYDDALFCHFSKSSTRSSLSILKISLAPKNLFQLLSLLKW
jgi:hypothetical protein